MDPLLPPMQLGLVLAYDALTGYLIRETCSFGFSPRAGRGAGQAGGVGSSG